MKAGVEWLSREWEAPQHAPTLGIQCSVSLMRACGVWPGALYAVHIVPQSLNIMPYPVARFAPLKTLTDAQVGALRAMLEGLGYPIVREWGTPLCAYNFELDVPLSWSLRKALVWSSEKLRYGFVAGGVPGLKGWSF